MAVQLAASTGIEVTGLVSRSKHESTVLSLGADSACSSIHDVGGLDVVFDTAGIFDPRMLCEGGRLITVSDDTIPAELEQRASSAVHNYVQHDPARLQELSTLVDDGTLTLRVAEIYPLSSIEAAHRKAEAGGLNGKIVITL